MNYECLTYIQASRMLLLIYNVINFDIGFFSSYFEDDFLLLVLTYLLWVI